jgi:predicted  nucleic acid-binding Zn-ribbon protein
VFGAIGRYVRAFGYLITGRIDSARKALSANPYVIQATYDKIVEEKTARIHQYKDAVAQMIAQEEKKMGSIKTLTTEVNKLEQLKEGAAAKAKSVVDKLKGQGKSMDEIKKNEDYMKCLAAFNDFSSTLDEKNARITELEADCKQLTANLSNHKVQLQQLLREVDKIREEAAATVADVITAKEEAKIADMVSQISNDSSSKELQEMRDLRQQEKAKARVSRELAGTDTKTQEADFLEYAKTTTSTSEFDKLIGLADEADSAGKEKAAEKKPETRLPEH